MIFDKKRFSKLVGQSTYVMNEAQTTAIEAAVSGHVFASGPAGSGKTTAAIEVVRRWVHGGARTFEIVVIVPQRTLGQRYRDALPDVPVEITTYASIVRRALDLFWPAVEDQCGLGVVREQPLFLTSETATAQMGLLLDPLIDDRRLFDSVRMPRLRIYGQVLDNLNKSALVGFPHDEIGDRLKGAWLYEDQQARMYDDVQFAASTFRAYCIEHGLLDYSLAAELFQRHVVPLKSFRTWAEQSMRRIVYDNPEEDVPAAHDFVLGYLESAAASIVAYDKGGGIRRFLGADEVSAGRFAASADVQVEFVEPVTPARRFEPLVSALESYFIGDRSVSSEAGSGDSVELIAYRFLPEMLDGTVRQIGDLIEVEGVDPDDICVVTPYLSDVVRFALETRLRTRNIPFRSTRPSRPLNSEPIANAVLVVASTAFPAWQMAIERTQFAAALVELIDACDPVRAGLLAATLRVGRPLAEADSLSDQLRRRLPDSVLESYERMRVWLVDAAHRHDASSELATLLGSFYSEALTQPGFRLYERPEAGHVVANLIDALAEHIELAKAMDRDVSGADLFGGFLSGRLGQQGLVDPRGTLTQPSVLVGPAHTFLMLNRAVAHQFWLDVGSSGWTERLHQPLGQPYVLSRQWPAGRVWTSVDDAAANALGSARLVSGLLRRCTERAWLSYCVYSEQGIAQQGPLLSALQAVRLEAEVGGGGA